MTSCDIIRHHANLIRLDMMHCKLIFDIPQDLIRTEPGLCLLENNPPGWLQHYILTQFLLVSQVVHVSVSARAGIGCPLATCLLKSGSWFQKICCNYAYLANVQQGKQRPYCRCDTILIA